MQINTVLFEAHNVDARTLTPAKPMNKIQIVMRKGNKRAHENMGLIGRCTNG